MSTWEDPTPQQPPDAHASRRALDALGLSGAALIEFAPDGILVVDGGGLIRWSNAAMGELCGHDTAVLLGQSVDVLLPPHARSAHAHHVHRFFGNPYVRTMGRLGKLRLWHREGREVAVDISLAQVTSDDGQPYAVLFARDATEANAQREQLEQLAMLDPLTGLHNRRMFHEQLNQAVGHALRTGRTMAVCLVDLDDFKSINDGYGHHTGDDVLKEAARRLRMGLRAGDSLARLGGDEFAVLLRDLKNPDEAVHVARKIVAQLQQPMAIGHVPVHVGTSVGVVYAPDDAQDALTLMRYADMALYQAKDAGRGTHVVYDPAMAHRLSENLLLRERLQHALENNGLTLHYQPQVGMGGEGVVSVEALLRWNDPELGQVPPDRFIPVAESTGLILPLGDWVLETACRQMALWQAQGLYLRVAINVSAQQFRHRDLAVQVGQALQRHGVAPHLLELEVTESVAMSDPEQAGAMLSQLAEMGVGVALDDFGRGHSSLLYLLQLPVTRLKIDRMFIGGVPESIEHSTLTRAVIGLARTLGKSVVAEGVETLAQLSFLQDESCECCQGWYFSKAVPAHEVPALLAASALVGKL